ncbi:molybdenum cofactor guanylyltransferase MobA [Undibacterium sp. TS12]|uniref:molybdenum cofactor guanylyltransferase MobA n=1 Tax=Undibacterium sp. TS12 TaxID=2908202 RepID=UPI001F4D0A59|nr:molybdenum cofactor guanylyltransferase MobA [Undibacterium sp. TS12]MCH8621657.1 molybdenum cofactor guanylyltransferase MobA [Undibacterium sp. TS12]
MQVIQKDQITGLLLAGGRGTRMGQVDKGLQSFRKQPLALHVLQKLSMQTASILINANQNLDIYRSFGYTVWPDLLPDFAGPLAGIHTGMHHCQTPYLLCAPCDSPLLPDNLAEELSSALIKEASDIAVVTTMENVAGTPTRQNHPVFALMKISLLANLDNFLAAGERKMQDWYARLKLSEVVFEDHTAFRNINTLKELRELEN